jgi:Flp pilus assembly protein TadG
MKSLVKLRRNRDEAGTALIEHVLVLTVMLMIFFGVIDFGRALYTYNFVSHAAREGTRYASVRGLTAGTACSGSPFPAKCTATGPDVSTYLKNSLPALNGTKMTVTTTWPVQTYSPALCSTAATKNSPGCTVQVNVSYNYNFVLPYLPSAAVTMSSTSKMVISQ